MQTTQTQQVHVAPPIPLPANIDEEAHEALFGSIAMQRRERRASHLTISAMMRRIASIIGIDNRSLDTVQAIIACQHDVIKATVRDTNGKKRQDYIRPLAYTAFTVSLESIGRKMALKSAERESMRKSAGRRCSHLFNVVQPQMGYELVTRIKGQYNAKNPQESEAHTYIDNLTPLADWAYHEFKNAIFSDEYKKTQGKERQQLRHDLFEHFAIEAIKRLPRAEQAKAVDAGPKLSLSEYMHQSMMQDLAAIERKAAKIAEEYGSPQAAEQYRQNIRRQLQKITTSFPAPASGDAGLAAIAEGGEEEGSGYLSGTFQTPPETQDIEQDIPQDAGGGWDILYPPTPDNPLSDNSLDCTKTAQVPDNDPLTWARRYIEQGWNVVPVYGLTADGTCTCQAGRDCGTAGKHPIGGTHKATNDIREVERRLRQHPRANLGIVTGERSGIYVLDFDKAEGRALFRELTARGFIDGDALIQESGGGGIHYPLQWFEGLSARVAALPGLDIRAHNSQVVSAPSLHSSGNRYEWVNWGAPVAEASPEFKDFLLQVAPKEDKQAKPKKEVFRIEDGTQGEPLTGQEYYYRDYPSGIRNHRLYGVACALRGQAGAEYPVILGELRHRNNTVQSDKLSDAELAKIARSACRHKREVAV